MAIIATLIGGIIGFASFLTAMVGFDAAFSTALAIYAGSGLAVTALIIGATLFPTRTEASDVQTA
jgi:hypothetical protein